LPAAQQEWDDFRTTYSPDSPAVMSLLTEPETCYTADMPCLVRIDALYGAGASASWLAQHITHTAAYCGKPLTDVQAVILASTIRMSFGHLKPSEIILFFAYFRAGRYGRFYGNFDPMMVTESMQRFLADRAAGIERIERQKREETASRASKGISWEEYCRRQGITGHPSPLHTLQSKSDSHGKKNRPRSTHV